MGSGMDTVDAAILWTGPETDTVSIFVEPTPDLWIAEADESTRFFVLWAVDEGGQETGKTAGVQILGFLSFDRWEQLLQLPILWKLPNQEARPLDVVLRRVQEQLKARPIIEPQPLPGSADQETVRELT